MYQHDGHDEDDDVDHDDEDDDVEHLLLELVGACIGCCRLLLPPLAPSLRFLVFLSFLFFVGSINFWFCFVCILVGFSRCKPGTLIYDMLIVNWLKERYQ